MLAAQTLGEVAARFPRIDATAMDTTRLNARDARLAVAIVRTGVRRWLTIEYLLGLDLHQHFRRLEPAMQGVLAAAAAQVIEMDRIPARAVVDEAVSCARRLVRPKAGGMANAVLRKLSGRLEQPVRAADWTPAPDRIPLEDGFIPLTGAVLPPPEQAVDHLSVATSHPVKLVRSWREQYGDEVTVQLCRCGLRNAPTIVAVPGVCPNGTGAPVRPHAIEGFVVWEGEGGQLEAFLAGDTLRRVQDPGSARPVQATAGLSPRMIVDYCAGRGTKTRQLAALHPAARVIAADPHPDRYELLREAAARCENVEVVPHAALGEHVGPAAADLVVLDVPCSNTGVLARRPEARYRFGQRSVSSLVAAQQAIIDAAWPLVAPEGVVLYSTCSLDQRENQQQAARMLERGAALIEEQTHLPGGTGASYTDGSYHALIRKR